MTESALVAVEASAVPVWRVGRAPDPWAWIDPAYAGNQRWDDAFGDFRTMYAADSVYACFVEVLAYARPDVDADGLDILAGVEEDPEDSLHFPTSLAGNIPRTWISGRMIAGAELSGPFADIRAAETIAALRPRFLFVAHSLGYPDFDASALKSVNPRSLTQRIAGYLYALTDENSDTLIEGVRFASRHGDDLTMWAVFERPGDEPSSRRIVALSAALVDVEHPDLARAMALHRLTWG